MSGVTAIERWLNAMPDWSMAAIIAIVLFIVLVLIKRLALYGISRAADKKAIFLLSYVSQSLAVPLTLVILAICIKVFDRLLIYFEAGEMDEELLFLSARLLLIVALVLFIDKLSNGLLTHYVGKTESLKSSRSIIQVLSRITIVSLGLLVILGTMGISITPIIASLGITSLAVALALQPTLENFFSGVQLIIDKPIRVGDYVELDSGEQGFVEKIGWRTTWIKMLPNNVVIVPNSLLSSSKLINYYYPEKQLSVPVDVGVHYDSDLEHVERVTLEVAREVLKTHKWGVGDYDTFVVFHTFDSSSINFTVMLRAEEYFNRFFVKSEFMKALHKRYQQEGITIPYPIRAINYEQEKAKS